MELNPVKIERENGPDLKQGTTLFRAMYNDLFSDNRNITIIVLVMLVLLAFSRINFIDSLAIFFYRILLNLYNFISGLIFSTTYSFGEILNGSSNTVAIASKTTLDLGNGAINDIGNLMTDVNCQYRGNPVQPNQCRGGAATAVQQPPIYVTSPTEPVVTGLLQPSEPTRRRIITPTPLVVTGKMLPGMTNAPQSMIMATAPPSVVTTALTPDYKMSAAAAAVGAPTTKSPILSGEPDANSLEPISSAMAERRRAMAIASGALPPGSQSGTAVSTGIQSAGPITVTQPQLQPGVNSVQSASASATAMDAPVGGTIFETAPGAKGSALSLDNALEGMTDRRAAAFVPDPVDTASNTTSKMKSSWCLIGDFDNKKTCVEIYPSVQSCQSGMLYPDQATCSSGSVRV
jgi:hypothetical protein